MVSITFNFVAWTHVFLWNKFQRSTLCSLQLRPISTSKLNTSRCVHFSPINPVIYWGSITIPHLGVGLVLEMLSALIPSRSSYPTLPVFRQLAHQGSVRLGPLVLETSPLKNLTLTQDRDRQFCYEALAHFDSYRNSVEIRIPVWV